MYDQNEVLLNIITYNNKNNNQNNFKQIPSSVSSIHTYVNIKIDSENCKYITFDLQNNN